MILFPIFQQVTVWKMSFMLTEIVVCSIGRPLKVTAEAPALSAALSSGAGSMW
jgi:hypothetical protein